jgi:hypothetical protein
MLPALTGCVLEYGGSTTVSNCREHGDLMRELARGCLDDERSLSAETVRDECADCARWWNEAFNGRAYDAVDEAVAQAISSFVSPARRRYGWLAAAAALVLAVGIGATSMLWRSAEISPVTGSEVVSTWDFEAGTLNEAVAATGEVAAGSDEANGNPAVFVGDFESGDLSSWSTNS